QKSSRSFGLTSASHRRMVSPRWFLSYDRRRGNAIGLKPQGFARKAAAPATVTGEMPKPLIPHGVGKVGIEGKILLRKPGDLPTQHVVRPADGVFRDGETGLSASGSCASSLPAVNPGRPMSVTLDVCIPCRAGQTLAEGEIAPGARLHAALLEAGVPNDVN